MKIPVELKVRYLSRRMHDIENLKSSLEMNDFSVAMKLGHQVKGNAKTFDFPLIANLGIAMELAARQGDKEKVRTLIHDLEFIVSQEKVNFPQFQDLF